MTPASASDKRQVTQPPEPAAESLTQTPVHMVGIGGCGMSGLAALLHRRGWTVSGTDRASSIALARLAAAGVKISTRQTGAEIPPGTGLVVASAAVPADHPELAAARSRGLPIMKYAELLGHVMARHVGIAISGTHGKSTTSAWLTYVLKRAGLDPSFVIGAGVDQLDGSSGVGDGAHFVAEACEYDRSFLNLRPNSAAILNIEEDHLDCYANLDAIRATFVAFAERVSPQGLLLLNADDPATPQIAANHRGRVQTFGLDRPADWQATNLTLIDGRHECTLRHDGQDLGRVHVGLAGRHNVANALAVAALATDCGVPGDVVRDGLATFRGARRRLEFRGEVRGVRILDDYAHHPTEIRATLAAAQELYSPRQLWCIFQPHQHSRTRFLLEDFAHSFTAADHVVVPTIYFVRDSARDRETVSASDLVERIVAQGGDATHIADFDIIVDRLADALQPGDVVITMGAGDIWEVADALVRRLGADLPH
jgi:UDP-N-acetylmuramate--alanine ligase